MYPYPSYGAAGPVSGGLQGRQGRVQNPVPIRYRTLCFESLIFFWRPRLSEWRLRPTLLLGRGRRERGSVKRLTYVSRAGDQNSNYLIPSKEKSPTSQRNILLGENRMIHT